MSRLIHLDDDLLVVDKPAGLLSVPARGADRQDCLEARVQALHPDALIVHRLDAATSGMVLFARGLEMLRRLSLAFEQRMVGKEYVAVVHGHLAQDAGEIDLPLGEDAAKRPRQIVDPVHGRRALTRYRVLARDRPAAIRTPGPAGTGIASRVERPPALQRPEAAGRCAFAQPAPK